MSEKPLRLAVFDCDGTLVDSQHGIIAAMTATCEACGFPVPPPEAVRRVVGLPLLEAVALLMPGAEAADRRRLVARYGEAFFAIRSRPDHAEPLFPGAEAALAALEADGVLLGIATGKSRRGLMATLERHGLERRFVTMQTGDNGPGKPNPDMLIRAMDETGTEPDDTVMIGDTTFDVAMARAAGAVAIGVGWGYHDAEELRAAGAHHVIGAFEELPATMNALLRNA